MPIQIVRNDITKIKCDAIVNAANSSLLGGGGVDGAIHKAAGKGLLEECKKLGGCDVGQAKITGAYNLPARFVIHTVGPIWRGGSAGEKELLESCYRESLKLALDNGCESVAFPLISSGAYGYPKDQALHVAFDIVSSFLLEHDMVVYIVVFDKSSFRISEKLFADITAYIDDNYVEASFFPREQAIQDSGRSIILDELEMYSAPIYKPLYESEQLEDAVVLKAPLKRKSEVKSELKETAPINAAMSVSLDDMISQIDESFSQMLLRKIDEKGMTDAECYKKANIDRKLFSKIRSDVNYKPRKTTAIAFAIALELPLAETKDLLMKAGFALSHSNKFDIIIEYFIKAGNYNIFEINEALFAFDQSLLGA